MEKSFKSKTLDLNIRVGFTLIELMVVIAIIAVLSGLSLFALNEARESGRDAKRRGDIAQIAQGIELFKADCNYYPKNDATWPGPGSTLTGIFPCSPATGNVYIQSIPDDPDAARNYVYEVGPTGCNASATCSTYCIWTSLENPPNTGGTTNCVNTCGDPVGGWSACGGTGCNFCIINP